MIGVMTHARSTFLASLLVFTAGCGARNPLDDGGSTGGSTGPTTITTGSTTTTTITATTTTTTVPEATPLAGHWVQQTIGGCINGEEWLSFSPPNGFVHTLVDRNFCGPHSVAAHFGDFSATPSTVELKWPIPDGAEGRFFTFTVRDAPFWSPPPPSYPGYVSGDRWLNVASYRRSGDALVWHRNDRRESATESGIYATSLSIDVALDASPDPSGVSAPCTMNVTIAASVVPPGGKPSSGTESFAFSCTATAVDSKVFAVIIPDGFELWGGTQWYDLLKSKGVYDTYDSLLASLFESGFKPVLSYDPNDTSALFHDSPEAWYFEMLSPPPDHAD